MILTRRAGFWSRKVWAIIAIVAFAEETCGSEQKISLPTGIIMENNCYRVKPSGDCKGAVIFLHGLGDSGEGWSQEFKQKIYAYRKDLCYVFPNAPAAPVTLNMGMKMPSWFDLYGLTEDSKEDKEGIKKMSVQVEKTVDAIMSEYSLTADKVVLGGFSQGGALALYSALTGKHNYAGVMALSTWIPLADDVAKNMKNHRSPVFFGHGSSDNVVPTKWGEKSADVLKKAGFEVNWKTYRGVAHSSCAEEFGDINKFLDKALKA